MLPLLVLPPPLPVVCLGFFDVDPVCLWLNVVHSCACPFLREFLAFLANTVLLNEVVNGVDEVQPITRIRTSRNNDIGRELRGLGESAVERKEEVKRGVLGKLAQKEEIC